MLLLERESSSNSQLPQQGNVHAVLIFGEGLVGSALRDELMINLNYKLIQRFKLSWNDLSLITQLDSIRDYIKARYLENSTRKTQFSFIWSAGKVGFGASNEEASKEQNDFKNILNTATQIYELKTKNKEACDQENSRIQFDFHYVSSAGGLFEGQSLVHSRSLPKPLRVYGELKLAQEKEIELLAKIIPEGVFKIYRPSTIYGKVVKGQRVGLISNMLQNGIMKRVTPITGDLYTMRDYIHVKDLSKMILGGVLSSHSDVKLGSKDKIKSLEYNFCLSQKPTTIFEIKSILEFYLKHRIYIKLYFQPGNSRDITFERMSSPFGVQCRDVRSGIKDVLVQWYGA